MSSTPKDDDDLIPLKEFARRLGRNVEAARRRFGDIAVKRARPYLPLRIVGSPE